MVASGNNGEVIMIDDVSRAVFCAKANKEAFVQLQDEGRLPGEEGIGGRLNHSMYDTRGAAMDWQEEYSQTLIDNGFNQGIVTPCVFHHEEQVYAHWFMVTIMSVLANRNPYNG